MDNMNLGDVGPQYLATVIVNLVSFVYGMMLGWQAPMQPILQANATNSSVVSFWDTGIREMSDESISWIAGSLCVGGIIGTPVFGYLSNSIGRKKSLMLAGMNFLVANGLFIIATNPIYLFVARFFGGLGGAGTLCVVPIYVGEVAEDRVRGILGSFINLSLSFGIVIGYVIGSFTTYTFFALFGLISAAIYLILIMWLPESPVYSLMNDRPDEAFSALIKLRGNHTQHVQTQINTISTQVKIARAGGLTLRELLQDRLTRKALLICLATCTITQCCGISVILTYSVTIFQAAGSTLSPSLAAITMAALQVVGALIATFLMEHAGRKMLLMISSIGMAVTLAPIAYFLYLKNHDASPELLTSIGFLPVTALSVYIIVFGLGFGGMPFVFVAELFKNEAKGAATSICMAHLWTMSFITIMFFSTISSALGIEVCFMFFSASSVVGGFFTHFCVLETKGKSLDQIVQELRGTKSSRSSPEPFLNKYADISSDTKEKA